MGAQDSHLVLVFSLKSVRNYLLTHGCHEDDESDEGDEGDEDNEGKEGEQIAKGKRAKSSVFRGTKEKTSGGLSKGDLMKNKVGKVVSKKRSAASKKNAQKNGFMKWIKAVQAARKALGVKGFVAVKKGTPLYAKAKALCK